MLLENSVRKFSVMEFFPNIITGNSELVYKQQCVCSEEFFM